MLFFKNRTAAREFAKTSGKQFVDNGIEASKRWAVKVI